MLAPHRRQWFLHTSQCRLACDGVSWTSTVLRPMRPGDLFIYLFSDIFMYLVTISANPESTD